MRVNCPRARTINALKSGFAGVFLPSFLEAHLADFAKISPALKKRAAQIKLLLMDVDGKDGSVTLLSQTDGTALEIKTFDAHDGQSLTLAQTAGLRTGCITGRESAALLR